MAGKANVMPPLCFIVLLVSVVFTSFAEERAIYIVLMDGDPVALHGGSSISREGGRRLDQNRWERESKTCLILFMYMLIIVINY